MPWSSTASLTCSWKEQSDELKIGGVMAEVLRETNESDTDRGLPLIFTREQSGKIAESYKEPEWARQKRWQAWENVLSLAWPNRRQTEWKKIDIPGLFTENLAWAVETGTGTGDMENAPQNLPQGVIFTSLRQAMRDHPDLVRNYLMQALATGRSRLLALHTAFWDNGKFLYVPPEVKLELPVESVFMVDQPDKIHCPHNLLVLDRGSRVTFVERFRSSHRLGASLVHSATEVFALAASQVHWVQLQDLGATDILLSCLRVWAQREAKVTTQILSFGGALHQLDIETSLKESGAESKLLGLFFDGGQQKVHCKVLQDHQAGQTTSDLLFKTGVMDQAKYFFMGTVRIAKGAQQSRAFQTNRNLLLSSQAGADSIPILEIEANDVHCKHAATVGPLDDNELFYLMSRGLSSTDAKRLIVEGFFQPVAGQAPSQSLKDDMTAIIQKKLDRLS